MDFPISKWQRMVILFTLAAHVSGGSKFSSRSATLKISDVFRPKKKPATDVNHLDPTTLAPSPSSDGGDSEAIQPSVERNPGVPAFGWCFDFRSAIV
jgi:hypothetical protein